ncbi:MAG TPA: hypothetical protein ENK43_11520 [Planctomycetes bacterium]|nr:hypothetical protein [Planctomycetota bacterium]
MSSCDKAKDVGRLLQGVLNSKQTLAVLDHAKSCEQCRDLMTAGARIVTGSHEEEVIVPEAHRCSPVTHPRASVSRSGLTNEEAVNWIRRKRAKTGSRRLLVFGVLILAALFLPRVLRPSGRRHPQSVEDLFTVLSLSEGRPVLLSPVGDMSGRPMAIAVRLPAGNERFRLRVLTEGRVVFESEIRMNDAGATFDRLTLDGDKGEITAVDVLAPFPPRDALALDEGVEYFSQVVLPNGQRSAPRGFRLL